MPEPGGEATMPELAEYMARRQLDRLEELTGDLVDEIVAENPGYHDAALVALDDLRRSCHDNLARVLQLMGRTVPAGQDPFDAAKATGSRRAEQQVPVDSVLRSFRLGGRVIWRSLVRMAKEDDRVDRDQLLDLATTVWTVVDDASSEVGRAYRDTELRIQRLDEHRRHALVEDLLRGRGREAGFAAQAAAELGLPAEGGFLVLVVTPAEDGTPGLTMPQDVLGAHGVRSIWQPRGQTVVGLVALERRGPDRVLGLLRSGVRARVGVGPSVCELGGVGRAYELAELALRTMAPGSVGLAELDQHLPEALVARSPELAERLMTGVLGPLLALPPGERDILLDTLTVWLDTNRSAAATASRLYCHRNTVLNRLRRLENLLGRSLQGAKSGLTLSLALIAVAMRGDGAGGAET
jgi:hypothetical protein